MKSKSAFPTRAWLLPVQGPGDGDGAMELREDGSRRRRWRQGVPAGQNANASPPRSRPCFVQARIWVIQASPAALWACGPYAFAPNSNSAGPGPSSLRDAR